MKTNKDNRYISLVWNVAKPYYLVRIKPCIGKAQKTFSLSKYGGLEEAFAAAQQWRDEHLASKGYSVDENKHRHIPPTKSWGACDEIGVSKTRYLKLGRWLTCCYIASWTEYDEAGNRKYMHKNFYYKDGDVLGERKAHREACKFRKAMVKGNYHGY